MIRFLTILAVALTTLGAAELTVDQTWSRASPPGAMNGAVFGVLTNPTASEDRLVSAACDVAREVQLHTVETDANGVKAMRQVPHIAVPAAGAVVLKPGSYHIMLIGLKRPLVAGEKLPVTFTFTTAGARVVQVPIGETAATGPTAEKCPLCDEKDKQAAKAP